MTNPAATRVLVADDSAVVRAVVRLALETAGYVVVEAADGGEALAAATNDVSVVLLDVEMPVLDGFATLAALKADPATADLPVVFLTGRSDMEDVLEALRLGAHDYLRKPTDTGELLARVRAAAQVTALRQELLRRTQELDLLTRTDHLTGLFNRRHLEAQLEGHLSASRRHGYSVTVLIVDVDHFKQVNDSVGHEAGDLVLQEIARRMGVALRQEDTLGRWGGEEFLVLLPFTDLDGAHVLAERLRADVADSPVVTPAGPLSVTVSIGGSTINGAGGPEQYVAVLRAADTNLYAAKNLGRNRCEVSVLV